MANLKFVKVGEVKDKRHPNLTTVIMVEDFLKENCDIPLSVSEIKKRLPKQVMHQTLLVILEYLWKSGKIIYGPKGIQWIYAEPEHLRMLMKDAKVWDELSDEALVNFEKSL